MSGEEEEKDKNQETKVKCAEKKKKEKWAEEGREGKKKVGEGKKENYRSKGKAAGK